MSRALPASIQKRVQLGPSTLLLLTKEEAEDLGIKVDITGPGSVWRWVAAYPVAPPNKHEALEMEEEPVEETEEAARERRSQRTFGWTRENPIPYGKVPGLAERDYETKKRHQLSISEAINAGMTLGKYNKRVVWAYVAPRPTEASRAEAAREQEKKLMPGMTPDNPIHYGVLPPARQRRIVQGQKYQITRRVAREAGILFDKDNEPAGVWRYFAARPAEGDKVEDAELDAAIEELLGQP
ncbi:hypothetical protein LTR09_005365 [Extremus antarcticus]|uniref:Uncharacterized protein n=1 Tax=Extremus antarcticus TaxID=702011 RepID=A0AAJ0GCF3_9PEZI|nr:hypothetical protein LTR09_005365 [Extremus antarcticus]